MEKDSLYGHTTTIQIKATRKVTSSPQNSQETLNVSPANYQAHKNSLVY